MALLFADQPLLFFRWRQGTDKASVFRLIQKSRVSSNNVQPSVPSGFLYSVLLHERCSTRVGHFRAILRQSHGRIHALKESAEREEALARRHFRCGEQRKAGSLVYQVYLIRDAIESSKGLVKSDPSSAFTRRPGPMYPVGNSLRQISSRRLFENTMI